MRRFFVDTGAWYALADKKDPDHEQAERFFRNNKIPLLTTNFIFDETITLLRNRLGWSVAKDLVKAEGHPPYISYNISKCKML